MKASPLTIQEYSDSFPDSVQVLLLQIADTIHEVCPEAEPTIQYGMPTYMWRRKALIHYAAYKKHLGVYPVPTAGTPLIDSFAGYKTSGKGTIQFPLTEELPVDLLRAIIRYRMEQITKVNS